LYDQLLTQQISHPRWRSSVPAVAANSPEEQARGTYVQPVGVNGHNNDQGVPPQQNAATFQAEPAQRQPQYTPASPPIQGFLVASPKSAVHSPVQVATNLALQQQRQQQYQQPQWSPTQQYISSKSSYVPPQPAMSPQRTNPAPSSQSQLHPQVVVQNSIPSKVQLSSPQQPPTAPIAQQNVYQSPAPASTSLRPPPLRQQQQQLVPSSPQTFVAATPTSRPPPSTSLVRRHHTINASSYHGPSTANAIGNSYLARHNTVVRAPAPPSALQHHPQYVQSASPPSLLPHFPSVPTSPPHPQSFPVYSPPVASAPQTERKEALLIDL
jgi:growth factor-regulated tyrosine kinase substrate